MHHWAIETNSSVGKWLDSNGLGWAVQQPWNAHPMDALEHLGGMHGKNGKLPEFNLIQKAAIGTPNWAKAAAGSAAGHASNALSSNCGCND